MKKRKITYCYLMERKSDGKKFVTFGNFREAWNKPAHGLRRPIPAESFRRQILYVRNGQSIERF